MSSTLATAEILRKYEYDVIFLRISTLKDIGNIIKQTRTYCYREELIYAIEKFIIDAVGERIQKYPKKQSWITRAIFKINKSLEKAIFE
jgi:hypothetical protein